MTLWGIYIRLGYYVENKYYQVKMQKYVGFLSDGYYPKALLNSTTWHQVNDLDFHYTLNKHIYQCIGTHSLLKQKSVRV